MAEVAVTTCRHSKVGDWAGEWGRDLSAPSAHGSGERGFLMRRQEILALWGMGSTKLQHDRECTDQPAFF
jgi:hypothetical protein